MRVFYSGYGAIVDKVTYGNKSYWCKHAGIFELTHIAIAELKTIGHTTISELKPIKSELEPENMTPAWLEPNRIFKLYKSDNRTYILEIDISLDDVGLLKTDRNDPTLFKFTVYPDTPAIIKTPNYLNNQFTDSTTLNTLNRAYREFWSTAIEGDCKTYPPKKDVVAWLISQGIGESIAQRLHAVIRPEWSL